MMTGYFLADFRANKIKTVALCLSLMCYFAAVTVAATLNRAIPEIAALPLKSIGVQTIVQKSGGIPSQMVGAIFPHSNGPIPEEQFEKLTQLPFVEEADRGLYFWYFDEAFFKAVLGVDTDRKIISGMLQKNIDKGTMRFGKGDVVIAKAFSDKRGLSVGDTLALGDRKFSISGVLMANVSGNIIPADIYMDIGDALAVVKSSAEMRKLYKLGDTPFGNVVLLRGDPGWQGEKDKVIAEIDKKLLIFSEKTFTKEILEQLGILSTAGKMLFLILGSILAVGFGLLTLFNLKSREREIATLRMIGWRIRDLKRQFIGENLILLGVSILAGSCFSVIGLFVLGQQTIGMELPWDISARPHFLPEENAIERVVSAKLPLHFDPLILGAVIAGFLLLFVAVSLLCFRRIKRINPHEFAS